MLSWSAITSASSSCSRTRTIGDQVDVARHRVHLADAVELGDRRATSGMRSTSVSTRTMAVITGVSSADRRASSARASPAAGAGDGPPARPAAGHVRPSLARAPAAPCSGRPTARRARPGARRAAPARRGSARSPRGARRASAPARAVTCSAGGPQRGDAAAASRRPAGHGRAREPPVPDDHELPAAGRRYAGRRRARRSWRAGRAAGPGPAARRNASSRSRATAASSKRCVARERRAPGRAGPPPRRGRRRSWRSVRRAATAAYAVHGLARRCTARRSARGRRAGTRGRRAPAAGAAGRRTGAAGTPRAARRPPAPPARRPPNGPM